MAQSPGRVRGEASFVLLVAARAIPGWLWRSSDGINLCLAVIKLQVSEPPGLRHCRARACRGTGVAQESGRVG